MYIYINFVLFVCCNIVRNTYTHWSHWLHIHLIFPSYLFLTIVTSRNSLPNCELDPSYQ